jgi:hypothetical protein
VNQRLSKLRHVGIAAALLVAGHAFAGTFQADFGAGKTLSTGTVTGENHSGILSWEAGWRTDSNIALQVVEFAQMSIFRNFGADPSTARYGFDHFVGLQALGYLPLDKHFELQGGVGVGRTTLTSGLVTMDDRKSTDGLLTLGATWKVAPHFNLVLDTDYLTKNQVSTVTLRAQGWF